MFFTERSEVKKFIAPTQREIDNIQILTKKRKSYNVNRIVKI